MAHIMIVNFNLEGITQDQYEEVCAEVAPAFAAIEGLVSKHWLANAETNTYGGVYVWENKEAMVAFQGSEMFAQVGSNPAFANITVTDFAVLAGPSSVTGVS